MIKALFIKEIKDHLSLYATIMVLTCLVEGYALSKANQATGIPVGSLFLAALPFLFSIGLLPFILSKTFAQEWREGTESDGFGQRSRLGLRREPLHEAGPQPPGHAGRVRGTGRGASRPPFHAHGAHSQRPVSRNDR